LLIPGGYNHSSSNLEIESSLEFLVSVLFKKFSSYGIVLLFIGILLTVTACGNAQAVGSEVTTDQTQVLAAEKLMSQPPKETSVEGQINDAPVESGDEQETPSSKQDPPPTQVIQVSDVAPTPEVESESNVVSEPTLELLPENELPPTGPEVGKSAPDFSMVTLKGDTISLSDLRGKNVLINSWVTWCVPCMEELEALENIHQAYQGTDFVVLSVNGIEQDNLPEVEATVAEYNLTYPVALDEGDLFWQAYRVRFLPTSFFVDENGIIRQIKFGGDSEESFLLAIEQLLAQ
jgi:peroxiredoxin